MTEACSIRIYGRVFNVGFRRYAHRYAEQCGIVGYVENDRADGSLHIEAEGDAAQLDRFTLLCGEGTPYSIITGMKIAAQPATGRYAAFEERR